ncbi:MAG TPA: HAMP domain-containing protein [Opitutaceae bacterium]
MSLLRSKLPLRSWLLVALLPVLGGLVLTYAFLTYRGLQAIILEGFDRKLTAVSTVTAAFIDPKEHSSLVDPLPVAGIAVDAGDGGLWSASQATGEFIRIDTSSGQADVNGVFTQEYVPYTATGDQPGVVFVADAETGVVQRVSTDTGEASHAFDLETPFHAMATDAANRQLYVAGREFKRIDLTTKAETVLAPLPFRPRGLVFDPSRKALWVLDPQGDALLEVDAASGSVRRTLPLAFASPDAAAADETPFEHPDLPVNLQAVAYDPYGQRLFGISTSLLVINPETGILSNRGLVHAFGREQTKLYLGYARSLRNLQNRIGTKFLYTQQIHNLDVITYGLDGSIGDEHSPLLSVDELPPAAIEPVQAMLTEGTLYVSGIQQWQQWGLLKTALAPIFDPATGRVAAVAGADIDIGTIQFDTHQALVVTVSAGLFLMLGAGLLTLVIARQLTTPLNVIRAGALRAAAGDYAQRVEINRPRELTELARQFSASSSTLEELVRSLSEAVSKRQAGRDIAALQQRLGALATDFPTSAGLAWGETDEFAPTASGAVQLNGAVLTWLAPAPADPATRTLHAATFATTARALLQRHGANPDALRRALDPRPAGTDAWILLTPQGCRNLTADDGTSAAIQSVDTSTTVIACPPLPAATARLATGLDAAQGLAALRAVAPAGTFLLVATRS